MGGGAARAGPPLELGVADAMTELRSTVKHGRETIILTPLGISAVTDMYCSDSDSLEQLPHSEKVDAMTVFYGSRDFRPLH